MRPSFNFRNSNLFSNNFRYQNSSFVSGVCEGKIRSLRAYSASDINKFAPPSSTSPRSILPKASLKPSLLLQRTSFGIKSWNALRNKNFSILFGINLKLEKWIILQWIIRKRPWWKTWNKWDKFFVKEWNTNFESMAWSATEKKVDLEIA